jgi:thiol-disulfide isomerase/thioredoxin
MKQLLFFIISFITVLGCKVEQKVDSHFVTEKFKEHSEQISRFEYNVQRIDTFPSGGVWNNTGYALIEKNKEDDIFGFSFYGKRSDIPKGFLYDEGIGYTIFKEDKLYETESATYHFLGKPGGQMIYPKIFLLDTVYQSMKLIEDEDKYILEYKFDDDTVYNVTNSTKRIELDKNSFFPLKVTKRSEVLGNKVVRKMIFSDVKVNDDVSNSIYEIKNELADFEVKQELPQTCEVANGKVFHPVTLPNLLKDLQSVDLKFDRLTLIDFWEVWCGPCIKSMPEVEKLKSKYKTKLQVVGIITENNEKAKMLVNEKGVSFLNLIGNKDFLKTYNVDSWPRYFLVDENRIIVKEYFGFSEQIEKDIAELVMK